MRIISIVFILSAIGQSSVFAAAGGPPPPKEPNCLAVYNACTGGGYIFGDAGKGNGLWKDCITPLMTNTASPKAPPPGVTFPAKTPQLTQQIQTCHQNHPKWGMGN
jgi:hypothetical protein